MVVNNKRIPKWIPEGEDAATFLRAIITGQLTQDIKSFEQFLSNNTVFAEKYKAHDAAPNKKGFRNLRLNFLKLWEKYQKWSTTRQGESLDDEFSCCCCLLTCSHSI
jgi:hypothetical protein